MIESYAMLRLENICKSFGAVQALSNVTFDVKQKEVIGLLGDNGAGKSTLIKIIAGVISDYEGKMYFNGETVKLSSPAEGRKVGIETVHQHLSLINTMSISRNFFLGREKIKGYGLLKRLDQKRMDKECQGALRDVGISLKSKTSQSVRFLSGGERQAITIARAMYFNTKLLILDEPTNNLSIRESRKVLEIVNQVKEAGSSVIFISHNVRHVYPVADRFVILERGEKLGDFSKKRVSPDDLNEMIATGRVVEKAKNIA